MELDATLKSIFPNNDGRMLLLCGPCVIENEKHTLMMAKEISAIAKKHSVPLVFKASFDKANRSSISSYRGVGLEEGLRILQKVKTTYGLPIITDVHETWQVEKVAKVADIIQIPAFLCRQTDLLIEAGNSNKIVNIKKGQFLSPQEMKGPIEKVRGTGNEKVLVTERGTFFGYNNLVVDMRSLIIMKELGVPVIYDGTHSLQLPGAMGQCTGGTREYIPQMARAAAAVGVDGFFLEVHDDPVHAPSDGSNMLELSKFDDLLAQIIKINELVRSFE